MSSSSVGIIGGADEPTAIFMTSGSPWGFGIFIIIAIILIIAILGLSAFLISRKK